MLKDVLGSGIVILLGILCGGCEGESREPAGYDFPSALPLWIVEDDPNLTIFERKDLDRDRQVGKMLVIPLYMDYRHDGGSDSLAIAHPFVYTQGEETETQLASLGQRENLRRLIVWVPGYFPDAIGRTFPWVPIINGKKVVVLELQPCVGSEESQLNAAMKTLLTDGDFVIEKMVAWQIPPPYSDTPTRMDAPYDMTQVVRSQLYEGRFFKYGTATGHVLWGFAPGTRIINRLSDEEKKIVATFADQVSHRSQNEDRPRN